MENISITTDGKNILADVQLSSKILISKSMLPKSPRTKDVINAINERLPNWSDGIKNRIAWALISMQNKEQP